MFQEQTYILISLRIYREDTKVFVVLRWPVVLIEGAELDGSGDVRCIVEAV